MDSRVARATVQLSWVDCPAVMDAGVALKTEMLGGA